jgi:hypothetical protein
MSVSSVSLQALQQKLQTAVGHAKHLKTISKQWIQDKFNSMRTYVQDDLWPKHLKGIYERNITPLTKQDKDFLKASAVVASAIAILTPVIFGKALAALSVVTSFTIILGACTLAKHRIMKYYDKKAWHVVENVRHFANGTTCRKNYFVEMDQELAKLSKPEYSHLEEDIKNLRKEIRPFSAVSRRPYLADSKQAFKIFIDHLKSQCQSNPADVDLLTQFADEAEKLGTPQANVGEMESKRLALNNINRQSVKNQLNVLYNQLSILKETASSQNFEEAKALFLNHVERLQQKLAAHKPLATLPPYQPTDTSDIQPIYS